MLAYGSQLPTAIEAHADSIEIDPRNFVFTISVAPFGATKPSDKRELSLSRTASMKRTRNARNSASFERQAMLNVIIVLSKNFGDASES